eukprot:g1952.t1
MLQHAKRKLRGGSKEESDYKKDVADRLILILASKLSGERAHEDKDIVELDFPPPKMGHIARIQDLVPEDLAILSKLDGYVNITLRGIEAEAGTAREKAACEGATDTLFLYYQIIQLNEDIVKTTQILSGQRKVMELDKRRREKVAADAEDIFARRYRLSKVRKELRKFSIDFNKLAVTKALRKVTMTLMGGRDTSDMEAILSQIAGEKEAKDAILRKAKDGLRARKLALKQKLINRGMRILDEEDEPLDAMEKNAKTHDWYEFLSEGYGVDEMFYDQLLRDDDTMFKDLKDKLQEIPSWKAEETDTRNALMQANELLTTEATYLAEEMKDLLHFEDKAHEDWLEEMAFVKQLQGEEKTRTDVQLRRRREQQWKSMQRKPKLPKTPNTGRSAMSSEDGWSYATDDIMSIGSSMAEGLSSEELKFFQRLEFELKQVNADIEYEMGINDAGNEFWTDDEIDYGEVSIPKHK